MLANIRSLVALLFLSAFAPAAETPSELLDVALPALVLKYHDVHSHPELSHFEERTAKLFADELRKLGYETTEGIGKYSDPRWKPCGVVGILKNGPGKTVLIRTELDALPVIEQTGAAYASKVMSKNDEGADVGVMHACGHDIHLTSALGTARILAQSKASWSGTVMIVGQPAEETVNGARSMLDDRLYERFPKPDAVFALHCDATLEVGKTGICPGYCCAAADALEVTIRGIGGHAARPDQTKDPIVMSAQFILALQTIVSREKSPFDPAVISVASIHAGTKVNIIPDEVRLKITVRTYRDEVRKQILASIQRIANGIALTAGMPEDKYPTVKPMPTDHTAATYNDPPFCERMNAVLQQELGAENVLKLEPMMGSEDAGEFALNQQIPLCYFRLGTYSPAAGANLQAAAKTPPLHSCNFAPVPGPTLRTGIRSMTALVLNYLARDAK